MRKSGITHRQLVYSPPNSLYLVHTAQMVKYVKDIIEKIDRKDIKVDFLGNLTKGNYYRYGGLMFGAIVLDHACTDYYTITEEEEKAIQYLNCRVRRPK